MMGLPKGLDNIPGQVEEFKAAMASLNARLDVATDAMVAQLMGEHGTDRAAELLAGARTLRRALDLAVEEVA